MFRTGWSLLFAIMLAAVLTAAPASADQAAAPGGEPSASLPLFGSNAIARALRFAPAVDAEAAPLRVARKQPVRACDGCPERRLLRPYLESLALNVMYNGLNHARGHESANISPRTMWANIKAGFEWDMNDWGVNQIGHPYQGSNYFTAGRANGQTFWEASAVAAFGSATWEYFYENNHASLNDFINTTVGGIAVGEVLYRSAWLVRNPAIGGRSRRTREIIAAIIDPMSGVTRGLSGDFGRIAAKPADVIPSRVVWRGGTGVFWQGSSLHQATSSASPFIDMDILYGDARRGHSTTPFEAFTLQIAAGQSLAQFNMRGRLFGSAFGSAGAGQVAVFQTFDFNVTPAYSFGGQGFELEVGVTTKMSSRASWWFAATGGATLLAAVDSLVVAPPGAVIAPADARRTYDYGPGPRAGGLAELFWNGDRVSTLSYQVYQVSVVDGTRATQVLQRIALDIRVPVTRRFAVGVAGEYFFRTAYFWAAGVRTDRSPQFRLFVAWGR